jgi:hypothetical protein
MPEPANKFFYIDDKGHKSDAWANASKLPRGFPPRVSMKK